MAPRRRPAEGDSYRLPAEVHEWSASTFVLRLSGPGLWQGQRQGQPRIRWENHLGASVRADLDLCARDGFLPHSGVMLQTQLFVGVGFPVQLFSPSMEAVDTSMMRGGAFGALPGPTQTPPTTPLRAAGFDARVPKRGVKKPRSRAIGCRRLLKETHMQDINKTAEDAVFPCTLTCDTKSTFVDVAFPRASRRCRSVPKAFGATCKNRADRAWLSHAFAGAAASLRDHRLPTTFDFVLRTLREKHSELQWADRSRLQEKIKAAFTRHEVDWMWLEDSGNVVFLDRARMPPPVPPSVEESKVIAYFEAREIHEDERQPPVASEAADSDKAFRHACVFYDAGRDVWARDIAGLRQHSPGEAAALLQDLNHRKVLGFHWDLWILCSRKAERSWLAQAVKKAAESLVNDRMPAKFKFLQRRLQELHRHVLRSVWDDKEEMREACSSGAVEGMHIQDAGEKSGDDFEIVLRDCIPPPPAQKPLGAESRAAECFKGPAFHKVCNKIHCYYDAAQHLQSCHLGFSDFKLGDYYNLVKELFESKVLGMRQAPPLPDTSHGMRVEKAQGENTTSKQKAARTNYVVPYAESDDCRKIGAASEAQVMTLADVSVAIRDILSTEKDRRGVKLLDLQHKFFQKTTLRIQGGCLGFGKVSELLAAEEFTDICMVYNTGSESWVRAVEG